MSPTDQVLQAIKDFWQEYTVPPTIRAVKQATGISSTSLIHFYYQKLEASGEIKRIKSKPVPIQIHQLIKTSKGILT
jgi:SOS-response transcriptional repressor LexA